MSIGSFSPSATGRSGWSSGGLGFNITGLATNIYISNKWWEKNNFKSDVKYKIWRKKSN